MRQCIGPRRGCLRSDGRRGGDRIATTVKEELAGAELEPYERSYRGPGRAVAWASVLLGLLALASIPVGTLLAGKVIGSLDLARATLIATVVHLLRLRAGRDLHLAASSALPGRPQPEPSRRAGRASRTGARLLRPVRRARRRAFAGLLRHRPGLPVGSGRSWPPSARAGLCAIIWHVFEIGDSLRAARLRRGLDFGQGEQATKIRSKYLRALEDEHFEQLPSPTYVKGFLNAYAEYLEPGRAASTSTSTTRVSPRGRRATARAARASGRLAARASPRDEASSSSRWR